MSDGLRWEDHTFAICAYKESEYLEDCIISLKKQVMKSNIIMCTSTPNEHIRGLALKYGISLYIRDGASDIRDDWNYAYNTADTRWVTVAHQDDCYNEFYTFHLRKKVESMDNVVAFFSDYKPIKDGRVGKRDINSRIRRFLRTPMKSRHLAYLKSFKRGILAFGNSICCPTVTYNKEKLGDNVFTSELKFNIDWDTFYKLAGVDGAFAYVDKPLGYYRVHDGATSKEFIVNNTRQADDEYMFRKFWPGWMAKFLMKFYKKAYDTYG